MLIPVLVTGAVLTGLALSRKSPAAKPGDDGPGPFPPPDVDPNKPDVKPPPPPPPGDMTPKVGSQVIIDLAKTTGGVHPPGAKLALVTVTELLPPGILPGEPRFNGILNGYFSGPISRAYFTSIPAPGLPAPGIPFSAIVVVDPVFGDGTKIQGAPSHAYASQGSPYHAYDSQGSASAYARVSGRARAARMAGWPAVIGQGSQNALNLPPAGSAAARALYAYQLALRARQSMRIVSRLMAAYDALAIQGGYATIAQIAQDTQRRTGQLVVVSNPVGYPSFGPFYTPIARTHHDPRLYQYGPFHR
jgi:hypothetical protein